MLTLKAQLYDPPVQPTTPRQDDGFDPNRPGGTYGNNPASPPPPAPPADNGSGYTGGVQSGYSQQGTNLPQTPYYSGHTAQTPDYAKMINDLYDKNLAAQRAQLDADYEAVMRQIDAAAGRIPQQYQAAGNDLNAQYERQRAAANEQMAANGLNVGAGSQAALAQNAGYQGAYGQLMQAQANAQADLERQRIEQEAAYQSAITQALKTNDYQRAVALMQEMKDQRNADLDKAKTLAGYGDFSGYAQVYGQDAANNMREVWNAQNPDFAYMTGNLTADQYYRLTGKYPNGTQASSGYGYTTTTTGDTTTDDNLRDVPTPGGATGTTGRDWSAYNIRDARSAEEALRAYNAMPDSAWDSMSARQQQQILNQMKKWGIS